MLWISLNYIEKLENVENNSKTRETERERVPMYMLILKMGATSSTFEL